MKTQTQSSEEAAQATKERVLMFNRSRWSVAVDEAIKEAKSKLTKAASGSNSDSKKSPGQCKD